MKSLFFILIPLLLFSCKKDPIQYTFEGTITENVNNSALSGVQVKVYHKPFNNQVTSNSFIQVGSTTTDAAGHYSVVFDREKATEFKVTLRKEGYFSQDIIINSGDVSSENVNDVSSTMEAETWVKFNLTNVAPAELTDELQMIFYVYRTGCGNCIENDYNYFEGIIDTTLLYQNTAAQYLKFTYVDVAGSNSTTDSLYMTPFDTLTYDINY